MTVIPIESMFYIVLLSIAALFSSVNAFPKTTYSNAASSPSEKGLVIARDLDDSVLAYADTGQIFDSTTPSELPTDKPTELTSPITDDEYSSNGFTVALHKDTPKLFCPYDDNVNGYAVYFLTFWSTIRDTRDWHQAILLHEIGTKHDFLYDITGDPDTSTLYKRVRDPFFVSIYPFTETRLEGLINPKSRISLFNQIVAETPVPACRAEGNCQTWVKNVLDAAIPKVIYPLTTPPYH